MRSPSRVRPKKASEILADHLRQRIVRRELAPGDSLPPENDLMDTFGVSRPTLREAFRVLEAEKLVEIHRGSIGGATVMAPMPDSAARATGLVLQHRRTTLRDVYDARLIIEPPAAGLLAANADGGVVGRLEELLAAEEQHLDDPDAYGHASARFHQAVLAECGNQTIGVLSTMMGEIVDRHTSIVVADAEAGDNGHEANIRASHKAHVKFVSLVRGGDTTAVQAYWRDHLEALGSWLVDGGRGARHLEMFD